MVSSIVHHRDTQLHTLTVTLVSELWEKLEKKATQKTQLGFEPASCVVKVLTTAPQHRRSTVEVVFSSPPPSVWSLVQLQEKL